MRMIVLRDVWVCVLHIRCYTDTMQVTDVCPCAWLTPTGIIILEYAMMSASSDHEQVPITHPNIPGRMMLLTSVLSVALVTPSPTMRRSGAWVNAHWAPSPITQPGDVWLSAQSILFLLLTRWLRNVSTNALLPCLGMKMAGYAVHSVQLLHSTTIETTRENVAWKVTI